jgi:hypothetical protein
VVLRKSEHRANRSVGAFETKCLRNQPVGARGDGRRKKPSDADCARGSRFCAPARASCAARHLLHQLDTSCGAFDKVAWVR